MNPEWRDPKFVAAQVAKYGPTAFFCSRTEGDPVKACLEPLKVNTQGLLECRHHGTEVA